MRASRGSLGALMCLLIFCAAAVAQDASATPSASPAPEVHVEEDPTRPIVFSVRNEYRNLKRDAWANTALLRVDKFAFRNFGNKGGAKGLIFRLDIPFNTVHYGTITKAGLGDVYGQVLYVPHVRRKFALAVGSGIVLPTATNDLLGQGKLILAPAVVPVWYLAKRDRLFLVRVQNFVSVAGKQHRANVNQLVVDPVLVHRLNRKWWTTFNNEFKWDWRSRRNSGIAGAQLGRMVHGKFGFWLKPEIPWGPGRAGDFNLKFTVFRVR